MDTPLPQSPNTRLRSGIGLRRPHMADVLARQPAIGFLEIHPENYVLDLSARTKLRKLREIYPISLHGVGLSLGSAGGIDADHLDELRRLADELDPMLISDHLSWSIADGLYLNDLLPLPYTEEALDIVSINVARAQDALGRRILLENPSRYAEFSQSRFEEVEFLGEIAKRTGCGLLLDVNNVYVSAVNLGFEAAAYIESFPADAVGEIHLAGHARKSTESGVVLVDDHGSIVSEAVWNLYLLASKACGNAVTLVEWDSNIPPLDVLLAEARKADLLGGEPAVARNGSLANLQGRMARSLLCGENLSQLELGVRGHLSVHQNNVRASLVTALEENFPATLALVGQDYFRQVARAFLQSHPPEKPCIAAYGANFPDFLGSASGTEPFPWLADAARLDWLAGRIAMADPKPSLTPADLALASQHDGADWLVFELQEPLAYLSSPHAADRIWSYAKAMDGSAPAPELDRVPCFIELFNDGDAIKLRSLDEANFIFRKSLKEGKPLAAADSSARGADPFFDLSHALRTALRDGILVNCSAPTSATGESQS